MLIYNKSRSYQVTTLNRCQVMSGMYRDAAPSPSTHSASPRTAACRHALLTCPCTLQARLQIYSDTAGADAQQLVKRIKREGWRGCKRYFNARVDANGDLLVQDAVLPTQTW